MSSVVVQKFGGSSVATIEKIKSVAAQIKDSIKPNQRLIVVVSAMGTYTDELLSFAQLLHPDAPARERDMLVTSGERISTALLAIALDEIGVRAKSLTGSQSGILTDGYHGNARITAITANRINEGLEKNEVVVVAGFQGVCPATRDITSLGRGGSDLTAIALATKFSALSCQIFTDVEGVLTADPRIVPGARTKEQIPWSVMQELAWAGAGVLHHRGACLAQKNRLPVHILKTGNPLGSGTLISGDVIRMEGPQLFAIAQKKNVEILDLQFKNDPKDLPSFQAMINALWEKDASPSILNYRYKNGFWFLNLVIEHAGKNALLKALEQEIIQVDAIENMASVSVVGAGFRQSPELLSSVFSSVKVPIVEAQANDTNITFYVSSQHAATLCHDLHALLF